MSLTPDRLAEIQSIADQIGKLHAALLEFDCERDGSEMVDQAAELAIRAREAIVELMREVGNPMRRCAILSQSEWDGLPVLLGVKLTEQFEKLDLSSVIDKETGKPIEDHFRNWLIGTLAVMFMDISFD